MKAVIYHADTFLADKFPKDTYKNITLGLKENLNSFNIPLIHITTTGHEGWGDENYFYDGDPKDTVYNREKFFLEFLKTCPEDTYWFTEPDSRLHGELPLLTTDLALLRRNDEIAISPWWRLAKKSSVPFFEEVLKNFDMENKSWHGDSTAYIKTWEAIGKPGWGIHMWNGISIDFRDYRLYTGRMQPYSRQWKSHKKLELITNETKTI
jgi:hypothetical protein